MSCSHSTDALNIHIFDELQTLRSQKWLPEKKSDDAPVTYGELRRAMKTLLDLSSQMTLYSTQGLATAIMTKPDSSERAERERREKELLDKLVEHLDKVQHEYRLNEIG